jgi:hypothetical protein
MADIKAKRPARLDITDLPRDKNRVLGGLRLALCASFNYCRKYEAKMKVLEEVLEYVLGRVKSYSKDVAETTESMIKEKLEADARELGLELDSRMTVDNMKADFEAKKAELDKALEKAQADEKAKADKLAEDAKKAAPATTEKPKSPVVGAKVSQNPVKS